MARIVKLDRAGPYRIDPADFPKDGKAIWICGCGLTRNAPYCDQAHKACATEEPGRVYEYGDRHGPEGRRPLPPAS